MTNLIAASIPIVPDILIRVIVTENHAHDNDCLWCIVIIVNYRLYTCIQCVPNICDHNHVPRLDKILFFAKKCTKSENNKY